MFITVMFINIFPFLPLGLNLALDVYAAINWECFSMSSSYSCFDFLSLIRLEMFLWMPDRSDLSRVNLDIQRS